MTSNDCFGVHYKEVKLRNQAFRSMPAALRDHAEIIEKHWSVTLASSARASPSLSPAGGPGL